MRISSAEKSCDNTGEKMYFFYVCLISPIICWHVTPPSRHSPRFKSEDRAFTILNLRSFALSEFFQIMAAKTLKNPYRLQIVTFKLC